MNIWRRSDGYSVNRISVETEPRKPFLSDFFLCQVTVVLTSPLKTSMAGCKFLPYFSKCLFRDEITVSNFFLFFFPFFHFLFSFIQGYLKLQFYLPQPVLSTKAECCLGKGGGVWWWHRWLSPFRQHLQPDKIRNPDLLFQRSWGFSALRNIVPVSRCSKERLQQSFVRWLVHHHQYCNLFIFLKKITIEKQFIAHKCENKETNMPQNPVEDADQSRLFQQVRSLVAWCTSGDGNASSSFMENVDLAFPVIPVSV